MAGVGAGPAPGRVGGCWGLQGRSRARGLVVGAHSPIAPGPGASLQALSPRLTPELRHQQRQQHLRLGPGARDRGQVEVRGSHGQDLDWGAESGLKQIRCQRPLSRSACPLSLHPHSLLRPVQSATDNRRRGRAIPAGTAVMSAIILMTPLAAPFSPPNAPGERPPGRGCPVCQPLSPWGFALLHS